MKQEGNIGKKAGQLSGHRDAERYRRWRLDWWSVVCARTYDGLGNLVVRNFRRCWHWAALIDRTFNGHDCHIIPASEVEKIEEQRVRQRPMSRVQLRCHCDLELAW
jgi:hypothetical protein